MASVPPDRRTFFLHYHAGYRPYLCVVDEQRRPFDFSDNTFKSVGALANQSDACLHAKGTWDSRADYGFSYSVELDLARLRPSAGQTTVPDGGLRFGVHWLVQVGEEPVLREDTVLHESCQLRYLNGHFEPVDELSREMLDQDLVFEKKARREKEYRQLQEREWNQHDEACERLTEAVNAADVAQVLLLLAEDLCRWAVHLKEHLFHHFYHHAKDPLFCQMRNLPRDAPFLVMEHWVVRDWLGAHEAHDLLEFHKSVEYARGFSSRLDRLHNARAEFSRLIGAYTVQYGGDIDLERFLVVDEFRKDLKHMAFHLAGHLTLIATQFPASEPHCTSQPAQAGEQRFSSARQLSETKKLVLRGVLELDAIDEKRKVACPEIAQQIHMAADARLRGELADLRDLGLLGGTKGSRGYWLTDAGIHEARAPSQPA